MCVIPLLLLLVCCCWVCGCEGDWLSGLSWAEAEAKENRRAARPSSRSRSDFERRQVHLPLDEARHANERPAQQQRD